MTALAVPGPVDTFTAPPVLRRKDGEERRVGVEVEFSGLGVDESAEIVRGLFGGAIEPKSRFASTVTGAWCGDYRAEIDSTLLKEQRYRAFLGELGLDDALGELADDLLGATLRQWVPTEIVTPPIPFSGLARTETLRSALRARDAEGTGASMLYTFGFQLNPDAPALDAETLLRYLRSFLALHDWIFAAVDVDVSRRLTSFVDPFPDDYRAIVLSPDYAPDLDALIGDYLTHNPTRNRALDMLPVFATLRHDEVIAKAKEHKQVKPRPAFHYRLPNCLVDEPSWSFALEWNRWAEVEKLAEDPDRLAEVSRAVREGLGSTLDRAGWLDRAKSWGVVAP